MPARQLKRKPKPYEAPVDIVGNHTCEHGVPTNRFGEKPAFCIQCTRAVRATGHKIFRSVKPESYESVEARQKAEDDESERRKTFAERMHAKRVAAKEAKELMAALTPEERAEIKDAEARMKAIRKANKLRKARGLGAKSK
jgi:ribosomal protein L14E/L6E/L27E